MTVRIFRTDGGFQEIKASGGKKEFDNEKTMQSMIEGNVGDIFPDMVFVKSEHSVGGMRVDSVMFDTEKRSFVLFEYKNHEKEGHLEQIGAYYDLLEKNREAFLQMYNEVRQKTLTMKDIDWNESLIVAISPGFTKYQLHAVNHLNFPIDLYAITSFEGGVFTLERKQAFRPAGSKGGRVEQPSEYNLNDYMDGRYNDGLHPNSKAKGLFTDIIDAISKELPDLAYRQRKEYGGFYSQYGSMICCLYIRQDNIKIHYVIKQPDAYAGVDKSFIIPIGGDGDDGREVERMSFINSNSDIQEAVKMVEIVHGIKVKSRDR